MRTWLAHQVRALASVARKLAGSPLASLFNVIVVGIALALPVGLYVGLSNVQTAARAAAPEPQLTVFLALDAPRAQVRDIDTRLRQHDGVAKLRFIPRDQALQALEQASGMAGVAEGLGQNPLPDAFVVDTRDASPAALQRLRTEFSAWPGVAHVQLDTEWAQRLDALVKLGRAALLVLATALAFALVAITFNTIRLQVLTQREEIEVATLIGATDGFIRRPFLYFGAALGVLGGVAACALVWAATTVLNSALADLARLYGAHWQAQHLTLADSASVLGFSAVLGWLGAWLSVTRHLSRTRPR